MQIRQNRCQHWRGREGREGSGEERKGRKDIGGGTQMRGECRWICNLRPVWDFVTVVSHWMHQIHFFKFTISYVRYVHTVSHFCSFVHVIFTVHNVAICAITMSIKMWQLSIEDITVHAGLYEENSAFRNLQVCNSYILKTYYTCSQLVL